MPELLETLAALAMCCLGCAVLALSQREHWVAATTLLPYPSRRRLRKARVVAAVLLGAALVPCLAGQGAGFALLSWMLVLPCGAMAVAFVLAWRPRWLAPLAFFMCDIV